ncbi:hypothetical protein CBF34_06255 [Vagococcus penaei]|uniref:Uncharacterized protein n=1 Tax=Vagococcus penaei TaxID=633807 RepID=A0A1Q2D6T4_9ENTE|nr:DUF6681 family protein [Vagococcus penaei]AQP54136.1 hypothetical protein BW732_07835 [Vagococcus penaei]RSU02135.1 hypothetical protein CBF34_06255 [Vagococcus penaei]
MEALLALVFTNISKFLNYLNINPRLQNKIFTVAGVFPTLYILRIVKGYYANKNYWQSAVYLIIFIILMYFIIINFIYYFRDKKVKWDVTNFIEDIVPEDVTFNGDAPTNPASTPVIHGEKLALDLVDEADMILEDIIQKLIDSKQIAHNELSVDTYFLDKYTLIPYYKIRYGELFIGSSYKDMQKIATIHLKENADDLVPLGVFVLGGPYKKDGIIYKEPYAIQLRVKEADKINATESEPTTSDTTIANNKNDTNDNH